jgi:hypothetical protein
MRKLASAGQREAAQVGGVSEAGQESTGAAEHERVHPPYPMPVRPVLALGTWAALSVDGSTPRQPAIIPLLGTARGRQIRRPPVASQLQVLG